MPRSRRKVAVSTRREPNQVKWLVPALASLLLFIVLWFDHGRLADEFNLTGGRTWRARRVVDRAPAPPLLLRKTLSEFSALMYNGQRPLLIEDAVDWRGMKDWSRKRFADTYGEEMLVLTTTQGGLSKREVMVAPVVELNKYAQNTSADQWAMVEDEHFLVLRESLMAAAGPVPYADQNLFSLFPENCRPSNLSLIWGSSFARSVLRVPNFNATAAHTLLQGKRRWTLFPPSQSEHLSLDRGGVTSGLGLQCQAYTSPVDAFAPRQDHAVALADANALVFDQYPGEVLLVPPGWFAQWLSVSETIGTMTPIMNKYNYGIILSEIMKIREQIDWSKLPLDLEGLPHLEQIQHVIGNLVDAVHWRANVTRSAMMMQYAAVWPRRSC
eukprot:TRINITY_DN11456_c0_g1_i4.p1 TRINITY_DN11456_c0_g1~~TRINITY_DN11456_c0_g1_i4.p1  ORF type:complete len:384 (-),score=50.82 TRINITY_DN11456_c0_g1_i4:694-1845(-)